MIYFCKRNVNCKKDGSSAITKEPSLFCYNNRANPSGKYAILYDSYDTKQEKQVNTAFFTVLLIFSYNIHDGQSIDNRNHTVIIHVGGIFNEIIIRCSA